MTKNENTIFRDKSIASFVHFIISLIAITSLALIIFFVWYPSPFDSLFSVKDIFGLLVIVDMILGPLCTFIVYKKHKKTLKMDLFIIGFVQFIAFVFGVYNIANARPAWYVYHSNVLYVVSPSMLVKESGEKYKHSFFHQNFGKARVMKVRREFLDDVGNSDVPIIYQFNKLESMTSTELSEKKLPINLLKEYDVNFYNNVKVNFVDAKGYLPLLTESSLKVPALLIDEHGYFVQVVLEEDYE